MTRAEKLPSELSGRAFTIREAARRGVTSSRLRASDLTTPSNGIRTSAFAEIPLIESLRPYLSLTEMCVASHTTAARLHGIPLPFRVPDEPFHISRPADRPAQQRRNVVGHKLALAAHEIIEQNGIRVTSPARTWLDVAPLLTLEELVAAGDHIVCAYIRHFGPPRKALASFRELQEVTAAHSRSRGVVKCREALMLIRVGVDSPQETRLRLCIINWGLPEPEVNYPLTDEFGIPVRWLDLAYPEYRVALQYEGDHHRSKKQWRADIRRDEDVVDQGWQVIRVTSHDLQTDVPEVIPRLKRALTRGGWPGGRRGGGSAGSQPDGVVRLPTTPLSPEFLREGWG